MILQVVNDRKQALNLSMEWDRRNGRFIILLFDQKRGINRQQFTERTEEKARDIFRQLERAYNLK